MGRSVDRDDVWGTDTFPDGADDIWAEETGVNIPKRTRFGATRYLDWSTHQFSVLMKDPRTLDDTSYHGKKFRRIFRVPYIFFRDIIMKTVYEKKFWEVKRSAGYIPLEIRTLIALRLLGCGGSYQDMALLFNVGIQTVRVFFGFHNQLLNNYC